MHDPETAADAERARQAGRVNRKREQTLREVYHVFGVDSIAELQRYLEVAGLALLSLDNSVPRNRTIIAMVGAGAKLIEAGKLADDVAEMKAVILPRLESLENQGKPKRRYGR
jgi:hypothetical protein